MIPDIYDTEVLLKVFANLEGHALYAKFGYATKAGFCKHMAGIFPSKPTKSEWKEYILELLLDEDVTVLSPIESNIPTEGVHTTSKPFSAIKPIKEVASPPRVVPSSYVAPWESLNADDLIRIIIKTPGVPKASIKGLTSALERGEAEYYKVDAVELIKFNLVLFETTDWQV
jgi:hypothetical protein